MEQHQPHVLTSLNDKPSQGPINIAQLIEYPAIQLALDRIHRWTPAIKLGVANILSNRASFIRTGATPAQEQQFDILMAKVERCMTTDPRVRSEISSALCLLVSHLTFCCAVCGLDGSELCFRRFWWCCGSCWLPWLARSDQRQHWWGCSGGCRSGEFQRVRKRRQSANTIS